MLISMPTDTSTILGVFQAILVSFQISQPAFAHRPPTTGNMRRSTRVVHFGDQRHKNVIAGIDLFSGQDREKSSLQRKNSHRTAAAPSQQSRLRPHFVIRHQFMRAQLSTIDIRARAGNIARHSSLRNKHAR
jgi:hypothetical protein